MLMALLILLTRKAKLSKLTAFKRQAGNAAKGVAHLAVRVLARIRVRVGALAREIAVRVVAEMMISRARARLIIISATTRTAISLARAPTRTLMRARTRTAKWATPFAALPAWRLKAVNFDSFALRVNNINNAINMSANRH